MVITTKPPAVKIPSAGHTVVLNSRQYTVVEADKVSTSFTSYDRRKEQPHTIATSQLRALDTDWVGPTYWVQKAVAGTRFDVSFNTNEGRQTTSTLAPSMKKAAYNVLHNLGVKLLQQSTSHYMRPEAAAMKLLATTAGQSDFGWDLITVDFAR